MIFFVTPARSYSSHVGDNILMNPEDVYEVQADGHELIECERIVAREVDSRVATFVGAEARLIAFAW